VRTKLAKANRPGRQFSASRPIRLSDTDTSGRLRLDAVARYLQDLAADDVLDAGWAPDEHIWVVRRTVVEVVAPFGSDVAVELETWCSGVAGSAAARRYSLAGDRGGRIEAESIWIHLGPDLKPQRLGERFLAVYGPAAAGRRASTRLELPGPPATAAARAWAFRATDVDRLGHVNNAAYWAPLEERWRGRLDGPLRAVVEYRQPIDLGEPVQLLQDGDLLWLAVGGEVRSAARLDPERACQAE
jgi:acyl-ACP thioesterase